MTFPRSDYASLSRYDFDRSPVELDLSDNTNQWGAHPAAVDVLRRSDGESLSRYPELYADVLREAVSHRLGVPTDCVTTGAGSDDIIDSAYRSGASAGEFVALATPTFSMASVYARLNGVGARPVPWAEALDDPARMLLDDPAFVYVCRPNNPTGHLAPRSWLEELIRLAGTDGPLILIDEAYVEYGSDSFALQAVEHPRLVVCRTLSKAYGLAGLRVGYGVAAPATALEMDKSRGPFKVARLAAAAAAAAIADDGPWLRDTVAEANACLAKLTEALDARGLEPVPSRTNFVLFRAPSGAIDDARALRARGVAVRPFPGTHPSRADALRSNVAPWPRLERFLAALDARIAEVEEPGARGARGASA